MTDITAPRATDAAADWHPWREPRDNGNGGFETPYHYDLVEVRLPGEASSRLISPVDLPAAVDASNVSWRPIRVNKAEPVSERSPVIEPERSNDMADALQVMAHISFRGDVRFRGGETVGSEKADALIEGFKIDLAEGLLPSDIEYQAITKDDAPTPMCAGSEFCGSRGRSAPLVGFAVRTVGELATRYECEYRGRFADGSEVGPVRQGQPCRADTASALKFLQIRLVPGAGTIMPQRAGAALFASKDQIRAPAQTPRDLMMMFESLGGGGHGCEFGLVQRFYGAEPLSLLRWADIPFECLADALERRFEKVGHPETTIVFAHDHEEYWTRDTRFHMAMRTFVKVADLDMDRMVKQVTRRLKFLRSKLIEDLSSSNKIFVYRDMYRNLSDAELARLHAAVRSYGRNQLLYIRYSDDAHPPGSVENVRFGLQVGYVERFAFSLDDKLIGPSQELFLDVCKKAAELAPQTT